MPRVKVQAVETVEGCTHEVSAVKMHMKSMSLFHRINYVCYCQYSNIVYCTCTYYIV